jgi:hypothetical protein
MLSTLQPPFCILPRSRHLPVAVTDGSLSSNLNKIGVRLWTYPHAFRISRVAAAGPVVEP